MNEFFELKGLKVLCVFCNEPWDVNMELALDTSQGCNTCGFGSETTGTIDIYCKNCGKLVYRKEI